MACVVVIAWAAWQVATGLVAQEMAEKVGETVAVRGVVMDDIDVEDNTGRVKLRRVEVATEDGYERLAKSWFWFSVNGRELERLAAERGVEDVNVAIERGETVTIVGTMREGFGPYSGSMSRAEVVMVSEPRVRNVFLDLRAWFVGRVRGVVLVREASLGLGYLLGQKTALDGQMAEMLRVTGLTHIVVASGANVTVLTQNFRKVARRSRRGTLMGSLALVGCFMMVVGATPSMVRAGIVAVLALLTWYIGRDVHPMRLLLLVAAVTLLAQPRYLLDLGWQLSMGSFAGILLIAPVCKRFFYGRREPGLMGGLVLETLCASLLTVPLILVGFGHVSIISVVANLLVLPLIPFAMLATLMAGLLPWVLGAGAGLVATMILRVNIWVIEWMGGLEWGLYEVEVSWLGAGMMYTGILLMLVVMVGRDRIRLLEPIMVTYDDDS
ncbi:ComEC/Rec2 family competence protein [Candidatus Saccharibacteria bacterium]|nr:ComEC/Rec2 family competence protein [Candidatus Saccharibacteria bacterium]